MGLDMYLSVGKSISGEHYSPEAERDYYEGLVSVGKASFMKGLPHCSKLAHVELQVGYWRKANAIHSYFVNSAQDGVDDCRRSYVPRDTMRELVDFCKEIIDSNFDADKCNELLPPCEGFFFGSNEIDEWYQENIIYTYDTLNYLLSAVPDEWSFYYQASW